ncbi:MAG TPA: HD domain-containing protein, partial [Chryseolinea sp.]
AISNLNLQQQAVAEELLQELIQRSDKNEKGVNLYIAHIYTAWGKMREAVTWLNKSEASNDIDLIWRDVDPLLKNLRHALIHQVPEFAAAEEQILQKQSDELPKDLTYHNIEHIEDVVQSSIEIAEKEGVSPDDIRLIRIAAFYHDSGFIKSPKNHEEHGCTFARATLPSFGFTAQQIEIVCGMIMATKIPQTPQTSLEKILCDADLDYLGRDDFYAIGNKLFEEMKTRGFVDSEREWNLIQKTFLESHRYHTAHSRSNREAKKQQHLQEIIAKFKR